MHGKSQGRHRARRFLTTLASLSVFVVALAGVTSKGWILERYHRFRLSTGDELEQWNAAAKLSGKSTESRLLVEEWVLRRAFEATAIPIDANGFDVYRRETVVVELVTVLASAGEYERATKAADSVPNQVLRTRALEAIRQVEARAPRADRTAVAAATAAAGDLLGALELVGKEEMRADREMALEGVVSRLERSGGAPALLRAAAEAAEVDGERSWALHPLAVAQVRAGDLDGALKTAMWIGDPSDRSYKAVETVMTALAAQGDAPAALRLASKYENDVEQALAQARVARALIEGRHLVQAAPVLARAIELTESLPDRTDVHSADPKTAPLEEIAIAQWRLGRTGEARASFVRAASLRGARNQRSVVRAQAEAGDIEGALATAETIGSDQALGYVADIQTRTGDVDGALRTTERIAIGWIRAMTLADVAQAAAGGTVAKAGGTFQAAIDAAGTIPIEVGGTPSRGNCWRHIAWRRVLADDAQGAIEWAGNEESPVLRSWILAGIARGLVEQRTTAVNRQ